MLKKLFVLCMALACVAGAFAADKNVTMRVSRWGGDSRHKATLAAVDAYAKANPGVTIEAEYGG